MKKIFSRAPSRIDFAGGTLDLPFFAEKEKGATLHCAVKKYGYTSIMPNKRYLIINSKDYGKSLKIKSKITKYSGDLKLLKAAIKLKNFYKKVSITTYHEFPPHSRLGTSSSIGVSFLGAISKYNREKIDNIKIAKLATDLEVKELGFSNGPQDQYAAALGGINFLKFNNKEVRVEKLKIKESIIFELEKNLLLCYLGSSKVSGDINGETIKKYKAGDDKTINSIRQIKQITHDMKKALKKGDLDDFSKLLNKELENRRKLNNRIVNKLCKKFIKIGLSSGASAAKILGAGGGGTILFYSKPEKRNKLIKNLERNKSRIYDFRFDFQGLKTWEL
jgi:D-glycero-alpha-D-manno-heptose-7-phosphate kinase